MATLRLEELESRHVLNGGGLAPPPFHPPMTDPDSHQSRLTDHSPPGDFGARDSFRDSSWNPPSPRFETPTTQITWIIVTVVRMPVRTNPLAVNVDVTTPAVTADVAMRALDSGSIQAAAESIAGRGSAFAPSAVAARTNVPIAFTNALAFVVPAIAADLRNGAGSSGAANALLSVGGLPTTIPTALAQLPALAAAAMPTVADIVQAVARSAPAAPNLPAVLATLPQIDLINLSRGLEQFLMRLDVSPPELMESSEGLRPWVVAGGAAAVACELARRQFKRAAALADDHVPDAHNDRLFVG